MRRVCPCVGIHLCDVAFVVSAKHLMNIATHMGNAFKVKVAVAGRNELRVPNRRSKLTPRGLRSGTQTNSIGEVGLTPWQTVATPATRESRKSRKNECETTDADGRVSWAAQFWLADNP